MAVNILQHPRPVSWSRNPMIFELEGENYYKTIGNDVVNTLTFSAPFAVSDKLTIAWMGVVRAYEVGPSINFENPLVIGWFSGITTSEFVAQIASDLRGDQVLHEKFIIISSGDVLQIIPREKNTELNLTITEYPSTKVHVNVQSTVSSDTKNPHYAMLIELLVSMDGVHYETFTQSIIEPEDDRLAIWDVQEYLTAYLHTKAMQAKELNTELIIDDKSRVYYYIRMAEMYGSPQEIYKARESERFVAIYGGVQTVKRSDYVLPDTYVDGSIMDWLGNELQRKIYQNQLEYVSIVNFGGDKADITVKCRIYGIDESMRTVTLGSVSIWKQYAKLIYPIRISELSPHGIEEISNVEIWLDKSGNRISKSMYLQVVRKYYPYGNTLLFKNSLGNFETLYTYGKKEHGYEIKKESEVFEPMVDPSVMDATRKELDIEIRDEVRINSGYFSKNEIARFRDFFLSDQKYILQDGQWYPVLLDTSSIKEYEDGSFLYGITFTLQYANEQTLWV